MKRSEVFRNKLLKLRRDPVLFVQDAVRKRLPEKLVGGGVSKGDNRLTVAPEGYDVVNGLVLMSHPAAVEILDALKRKDVTITITW